MRRRDLFLTPLYMTIGYSQKPREWVTAAASRDTAPRVGLIPSTFTGSTETDGRKIRALAQPAPLTATLSGAQLEDMLRLAVELGGGRQGGLVTAISREDWVVIKVNAPACRKAPVAATDPRLVAGVLRYLTERGLGRRFSIVGDMSCPESAADTGSTGFRAIVDSFSRRHPGRRFELIDLLTAPRLEMPVEGRVFARRNPGGIYHVPRVLRECDKVISIAPLAAMPGPGIALSLLNYLDFAPPADRALGDPGEVAVDLFSFHPADYAIAGGTLASGHAGIRRHNVIIAGTNAPAVDAVGAAVMGFDSLSIRHLELAVNHGYGVNDAYAIWTRGSEIDEVKATFGEPAPKAP